MDGPAPQDQHAAPLPAESARLLAADQRRLVAWMENLTEGIETLLASQRWKWGNALGQLSCRLRGLGNPPTAAAGLRDTIARFRRWRRLAAPIPPASEAHPVAEGGAPLTEIIVCVHNAPQHVAACLDAVTRHTLPPYRLVLVDDGSATETAQLLDSFVAAHPGTLLVRSPVATGYTRAANRGLAATSAALVVLLNSDTLVTPGWLNHLQACAASHPRIGLVGPLSNAASWQSVPERFAVDGDWATNELPAGISPRDVAAVVGELPPRYPRVPLLNGFCLLIKRAVLDAIGAFDEAAFPAGYGEENDLCLRAADVGFEMALAEQAYVYHAKCQSYGNARRRELGRQAGKYLRKKYGASRLGACEEWLRHEPTLAEARRLVANFLARAELGAHVDVRQERGPTSAVPRVLFVLPARPGGGGVHSIVQESLGLRRLGAQVAVAIPREYAAQFAEWYPQAAAQRVFTCYRTPAELVALGEWCDVAIGTIYHSLDLVQQLVAAHPHVAPAYYVQDYEPWFCTPYSAAWRAARRSYRQIAGCTLFAKTQWLRELVARKHQVAVAQVSPSLDHDLFYPAFSLNDAADTHVCAMVRPHTPRRGALRTVRTLARLQHEWPQLTLHVFGCTEEEFAELHEGARLRCIHHGLLRREEVAPLLRSCQVFLDLSDFQAFGRTALEAMASGCAVVVPARGGAGEFARPGENAVVVNTAHGPDLADEDYADVCRLVMNPAAQARLRTAGLATAAEYSVHRAAISELEVLTAAVRAWRRGMATAVERRAAPRVAG